MQNRSTAVTIVGWIFVVLSGLGLLQCLTILFTPMDQVLKQIQDTEPAGSPPLDPALMGPVMHGIFIFMFVVLLWVLLSSFGVVMRKGWARISMIVLSVLGILWNLIYVLLGITGGPASMGGMMQGMAGMLAVMGAILIAVFAGVIYLLTRQKVKAEFSAKSS